jgi:hypothetical protein
MLEKHSCLRNSQWSRDWKDCYDSYSQSSKPTSITSTFEDMQETSIDLSIEMSEHVQLVQKRGQKY